MEPEKHSITTIKEETSMGKHDWTSGTEIKKTGKSSSLKKTDRKVSLIPRLKTDWNETKAKNRTPSSGTPRVSTSTSRVTDENEKKLRVLEAKEQKISEYYNKLEELTKIPSDSKEKPKNFGKKVSNLPSARKMISDTVVIGKGKSKQEGLSDFENNIRQISDIWLKTSSQLSSTLNTLRRNPAVDPLEFEVESVKIQLAIKQAKSLTLVKTRNVIAEAKKLMERREVIRSELEKIISQENEKNKAESRQESVQSGILKTGDGKDKLNGKGDSRKKKDPLIISPTGSEVITVVNDVMSGNEGGEALNREITKHHSDDSVTVLKIKKQLNDDFMKLDVIKKQGVNVNQKSPKESQVLLDEIQKKNTTITNLNNKVFDLQKACNEHNAKNYQLQVQLSEFQEKIQWNQILWKQLGKLTERIKNLQKNNKTLEEQKSELESKIRKLDLELDRLIKLNHVLNDKKYLLVSNEKLADFSSDSGSEREITPGTAQAKGSDFQAVVEKILLEKENVVEELKTMLLLMKEQETEAQKQVAAFQSKIKELEKKSKKTF